MSTRYYVGDEAPSPLMMRLKRTDGTDFDLTAYDVVTVESDGEPVLPPGDTLVVDAPTGLVQRSFDSGFTDAGVYLIRARLESDDATDYTDVAQLPVWDPSEPSTLIVSTDEVETVTGVAVSNQNVARAQGLVTLATGYAIGEPTQWVLLSASDQFWLQTSVAYAAACLSTAESQAASGAMQVVVKPVGVASMSTGDQSVSFDAVAASSVGGGSGLGELCPEAVAALRHLSWLGTRTAHARPLFATRPQPDPWVPIAGSRVYRNGGSYS